MLDIDEDKMSIKIHAHSGIKFDFFEWATCKANRKVDTRLDHQTQAT